MSKIKVDKKDFSDMDIYYLGFEHKKKISEYNVINSVKLLYLRITNTNSQFYKGKNNVWYLIISGDDVLKIKFESNNILRASKNVNIRMATIIIRAICSRW